MFINKKEITRIILLALLLGMIGCNNEVLPPEVDERIPIKQLKTVMGEDEELIEHVREYYIHTALSSRVFIDKIHSLPKDKYLEFKTDLKHLLENNKNKDPEKLNHDNGVIVLLEKYGLTGIYNEDTIAKELELLNQLQEILENDDCYAVYIDAMCQDFLDMIRVNHSFFQVC